MPPAARNRKTTLDFGPVIWITEKRYPGNMYGFPEDKWVYVLHQKGKEEPRLVDEVHTGTKGWRRMKRSFHGQRFPATRTNSVAVPARRYQLPGRQVYRGHLFFHLSPIPLGEEALVGFLGKLAKAESDDQRSTIDSEFAALRKTARDRGAEHRIVWGREIHHKLPIAPPQGFVAVRATFDFDAQGRRIKPGTTLVKPPPWEHIIVLEDPQAWIEEIHAHGVLFARDLLLAYRNDPKRNQMRFIAYSIASEIVRNQDKALDDELAPLPYSQAPNAGIDTTLLERLGWQRRHVVTKQARTTAGGTVTHRAVVPEQDWWEACNRTRSPNIAALYLNLDDLRMGACEQNMERFVNELEGYMLCNPRYAVLCAEHAHATQSLPPGGQQIQTVSERMALRNSVGGLIHSCALLDGLRHCVGGRRLIRKLSTWEQRRTTDTQEQDANPEINNAFLARGLFDGSQAFFTKKLWDNTAKRTVRSLNLFIESTLAGMLDDSFHHRFTPLQGMKNTPPSKVYTWVDRVYSRMLGVQTSPGSHVHNSATSRHLESLLRADKAEGTLESHLLQQKAKVYKSRRTTYPRIDAFLALVDALASVEKIIRRGQDPGKSAQDVVSGSVRDVVYVAEALTKSLKLAPGGARFEVNPQSGVAELVTSSRRLAAASKVIGLIGSSLDVLLSLQAAHDARNPNVKLGYLCQAVGASASLAGTVWGVFSGAAIGGPIGWVLAGAYLVGYVVGQVLIWLYSFEGWRDAAASCFLGKQKTGDTACRDLSQQSRRWHELYSAFEVIVDRQLHVTIKPGALAVGDRFVCAFTARPREGQDVALGEFEIEVTGNRSLGLSSSRVASLYSSQVGSHGWTSAIELRLIGDLQTFEAVKARVKLYSKARGLTLPLEKKSLEVKLLRERAPALFQRPGGVRQGHG